MAGAVGHVPGLLVSRAGSREERGRWCYQAGAAASLQHPACSCLGRAAVSFPLDRCSWGVPFSRPLSPSCAKVVSFTRLHTLKG